jgi:hypothetical protein
MTMTKSLFRTVVSSVVMAAALAGAAPAWADDAAKGAPAPVAAPASAAAEVKAAKGVEKREPVEEGTTFTAGTKVWIWSRITGANGTKVKHVWKKDGKAIWTAYLAVKSTKWTTSSRRQVKKAGEYTVDVVGEDGATLGSVTFTVQ